MKISVGGFFGWSLEVLGGLGAKVFVYYLREIVWI